MPFIGISAFMKFRPPFELDIIKNRAWKSAKMLQHSLRGEHVLGVTALTSYVDANQIAGKMQNEMAWLLLCDSVPQKKSKGNAHLRRMLDKLWFEGTLFLNGKSVLYLSNSATVEYIHYVITKNFVMTGHAFRPERSKFRHFCICKIWLNL